MENRDIIELFACKGNFLGEQMTAEKQSSGNPVDNGVKACLTEWMVLLDHGPHKGPTSSLTH